MNVLTQTWRQLVRRRLWPVALLLVAALVAVPVVLAKPASPPAAPADATAAAPAATPAQSYVQLASDDSTPQATTRRRVLGAPKDPFEPAPLPKAKKAKKAKKAAAATATPAATSTPDASGGSTGGGSPTPVTPVATAAPAPKKTVKPNSVEVRFGLVTGAKAKSTLSILDTLPHGSPLAVFMGFAKSGKVAVFSLTGTVTAEGDGTCDPTPQSCETLELRKGDTEFLTFSGTAHDGQYELDVNDLHATKSASASAAALVAKATPTAAVTATATATATPTP